MASSSQRSEKGNGVDYEDAGPALRERLGAAATYGHLALFREGRREMTADVITIAGERFERRLSEETSKLRVDMAEGFAAVRQDIVNQRFEILKWAFLFWAAPFIALASVIAFVIRFLQGQ